MTGTTRLPPLVSQLRVLMVMQYPGYLRYFDGVVRGLADNGHELFLAFESPRKQSEGMEAVDPRVKVLDVPLKRGDSWAELARDFRGTLDYVHYLHPDFADAEYLRRRWAAEFLPAAFRWLTRIRSVRPGAVAALVAAGKALERAIPPSPQMDDLIRSVRPDLVVVSPLITTPTQTDLIKAARLHGIPNVVCVASWDHLTTKGVVRAEPDRAIVWNEAQRAEAGRYHGLAAEKLIVTGAQPFDRWFERTPSARAEFCARVGLAPEKPFVLFTGSTASISAPELERKFVRAWISALRSSADAVVRELAVMVRPHPYNSAHWSEADVADLDDVVLWPRAGANPVNENDRSDYFDSLHHSAAVVGINTSAMIEAAIVGTPVLTIRAAEFSDTQAGTLHFHYLLPENGGFLRVAHGLDEHVAQLSQVLGGPEVVAAQIRSFVSSFVRPHGLEEPATPRVVAALEQVAAETPSPEIVPTPLRVIRVVLLRPIALAAQLQNSKRRARLRKRLRRQVRRRVHRGRKRVRGLIEAASGSGVQHNGRHDAGALVASNTEEER